MGQKYTNISDLYKQVKLNEREIIERKLTPQELEDREKIAKKLPMADFKKRYGKDAMAVKMATATNIVKKKSQEEETELDENIPKSTMYALVKNGKVVAKGSKGDMTSKMKKEGGKVFNAPSKKVGDTMKESLDEKFTKKDFAKNEDENQHTKNAIELVKMFGTSAEDIKVNAIAARHNMKGSISRKDQQDRDAIIKKYYPKLKEEVEINEDGHQDVASAIRQCKTITEDAMQILQKLQTMSPEDALPTWWTNKLAVASNSMNKMRDYLLVPSVSEEVELDEKAGDENDMKKLVGELQNASKMHLAQSKRVKAHVDMMKGSKDLEPIVGELEKASQAHLRQSKTIAKHMEGMSESLDEAMKYNFMVLDPDGRVLGMSSGERQANDIAKNNLRKVRGRVVKLRKPMAQTRGDRLIGMLPADNLGEEMINEQPEHEITVGNYTTKHFYMCGSAQTTMKKHADKEGAEELTRMQDMFYKMEKDAMDAGGANEEQKKKSQILYDKIMAKAKEVGIADEVDKYMKMHLDSMLKNDPKLGFGRTDVKESYQEMIARIMSQRSMR